MVEDRQILIIGANGQLGTGLKERFPEAAVVDRDTLDITNQASLENYDWSKVKIIVNAAAMTDVDGAETPDGGRLAWAVNDVAVGNLAKIAKEKDLLLVHYSTDYVFDGTVTPHQEDELLSPLGVYGQSKAAGDRNVQTCPDYYLIRTSWVIGQGKNFVRTMLALAEKGISPSVVSDQVGRPTFVSQLVDATAYLLENKPAYGVYNVSNDGKVVSWADFAREIFKQAGRSDITVTDITTAAYNAAKELVAPRPAHSEFDLTKIKSTGLPLRDWQDDLKTYLKSL